MSRRAASGRPSLPRSAAHVFALAGFAAAQPVYDLLEQFPTFLVAHQTSLADAIALAVAWSVALPAVLVTGEALCGLLSTRLRWLLHLAIVAVLVGLAALPPLNRAVALPPAAALAAAGGVGLAAAALYAGLAVVRTLCSALAIAALAFPLIFVLRAPAARSAATDASHRVTRVAHPVPVVMVVFDELSLFALMNGAGEIDAVRFPHFAALANQSTWYRNATAVADYTPLAVPAILSARLPDHNRIPILAEHPDNLFTWLSGAYRMQVVEPVTALCPPEVCARAADVDGGETPRAALFADTLLLWLHMLAPAAWRDRLPDIGRQWTFEFQRWFVARLSGPVTADRPAAFRAFLDRLLPSTQPTLYFAHVLLPHYPYEYLPSGARYEAPPADFHRQRLDPQRREAMLGWATDNPAGAAQEQQRYLLQLGLVDTLVGELLQRLRDRGLLDDALLVVTADHGVSFRPGESQRWLTPSNAADILWVPLFVKLPQQHSARIDDRNVQTIDIVPTVADALGAALTWRVDGHSVLPADAALPDDKLALTPVGPSDLLQLTGRVVPAARPLNPAAWQARRALFGESTPLAALYAYGPYPNLVGQPVRIDRDVAAAPFGAVLGSPERFRAVQAQRPPSFIRGHLEPRDAVGTPPALAIAVNGLIAATTESFRADDRSISFGALVPDSAFQPGDNRVMIYAVRADADGKPLLQSLADSPPP